MFSKCVKDHFLYLHMYVWIDVNVCIWLISVLTVDRALAAILPPRYRITYCYLEWIAIWDLRSIVLYIFSCLLAHGVCLSIASPFEHFYEERRGFPDRSVTRRDKLRNLVAITVWRHRHPVLSANRNGCLLLPFSTRRCCSSSCMKPADDGYS